MRYGRVYLWNPSPHNYLDGIARSGITVLPRLNEFSNGNVQLNGRFAVIKNGGYVNVPHVEKGMEQVPVGDAKPDNDGNFIFEPGHGGGRVDKVILAEPDFLWRYIQASHFGEVNSYYHVDRIASYIDELLSELKSPALPKVKVVVNAHHAATEKDGLRDGVMRSKGWLPFQGGHYRLPAARYNIMEYDTVSTDGEIHLGPGWRLTEYGKLSETAGGRYRANASHNPGIIYHEYGHHIIRHTADFRANNLRPRDHQSNNKTALDEGFADYWTASMLNCPHIWIFHHRHDNDIIHPRSLLSTKTIADYDTSKKADPHGNGTIWATALWDLRIKLSELSSEGTHHMDLLVLKSLLLLGQLTEKMKQDSIKNVCRYKNSFNNALKTLLEADEILFSGLYRDIIVEAFSARGIQTDKPDGQDAKYEIFSKDTGREIQSNGTAQFYTIHLLKHIASEEIADSCDIFSKAELESYAARFLKSPLNILVAGDIMLGDRAKKAILENGEDYPFDAILPIMKRSDIVLGNLEGPLAKEAMKQDRNFSYRVDPDTAHIMARAGINVLTLANNHLVDCGRDGILETLEALREAGIDPVGAGNNEESAHFPVIRQSGNLRIGILGYYWNRRCSATNKLPGCAMDAPEKMRSDIAELRKNADRIVVTFHWGIPYDRKPLDSDAEKARLAVDCGADIVVGHHPHVIQPFEIYRNCPIFYSTGNFAFGSGNSRSEGLMLGFRFGKTGTHVEIYPLYVKNRDYRVNYQPKMLHGASARKIFGKLCGGSDSIMSVLNIEDGHCWFELPGRTGVMNCE